jgi:hypothetical protein
MHGAHEPKVFRWSEFLLETAGSTEEGHAEWSSKTATADEITWNGRMKTGL